MSDLADYTILEISDRELDFLLDAATAYCRRGVDDDFERRHRERYAFDRDVVLYRTTPDGAILSEPLLARASDISLWGICVRATGHFSRHDRLTIDLSIPHADGTCRHARLLVEVRHAHPATATEMILGCAFRESLDPDTMDRAISRS